MKIKIKTLTPIHIGTGRELQPQFDYLPFAKSVAVLDEQKVLEIFAGGSQANVEDINRWVNMIDQREPLLPYLKTRRPGLVAADLGREIALADTEGFGNIKAIREQLHDLDGFTGKEGTFHAEIKAIREQLHDLDGSGILPGSSLKGAIRTALLTHFIDREDGRAVKSNFNLRDRRNNFTATNLEKKFFGEKPTEDLLRLLRVGDAVFSKTEILKTEVLNLKRDDWQRETRLETWVEAIPAGQVAESRLQISTEPRHQKYLGNRDRTAVDALQPERLFKIITDHTRRLVEGELKFWKEEEGNPGELGDYCAAMQDIMETISGCDARSCVLRCGWASGWKSMTGGWQRHLTDEVYYDLVLAMRPRHPSNLTFPKTTRFQQSGKPMGFLKLTII
ncbi:MAG: type III-A CRISPR-associated RAMP protein Csm5 [Saprospiraceae bacterium]|nr:type III-A CRISPR-associated RAMP protein Csm5 [Saprospiraceae bacterium]